MIFLQVDSVWKIFDSFVCKLSPHLFTEKPCRYQYMIQVNSKNFSVKNNKHFVRRLFAKERAGWHIHFFDEIESQWCQEGGVKIWNGLKRQNWHFAHGAFSPKMKFLLIFFTLKLFGCYGDTVTWQNLFFV